MSGGQKKHSPPVLRCILLEQVTRTVKGLLSQCWTIGNRQGMLLSVHYTAKLWWRKNILHLIPALLWFNHQCFGEFPLNSETLLVQDLFSPKLEGPGFFHCRYDNFRCLRFWNQSDWGRWSYEAAEFLCHGHDSILPFLSQLLASSLFHKDYLLHTKKLKITVLLRIYPLQ